MGFLAGASLLALLAVGAVIKTAASNAVSAECALPDVIPSGGDIGIGSMAPSLSADLWIHGDPVPEWKPGTAYLVLFWSEERTENSGGAFDSVGAIQALRQLDDWTRECQPAGLTSIAHYTGHVEEAARNSLKMLEANPAFRVSASPRDPRFLFDRWCASTGLIYQNEGTGSTSLIRGPVAFLINQEGKLAWFGHFKSMPKAVVKAVLAKHFDLPRATGEYRMAQEAKLRAKQHEDEFFRQLALAHWDAALKVWKERILFAPAAWKQFQALEGRLYVALAKKQKQEAADLLEQIFAAFDKTVDSAPDKDRQELSSIRLSAVVWNFVVEMGCDLSPKSADLIIGKMEARGENGLRMHELRARAALCKGDRQGAIAHQKEAIAISDPLNKPELEAALDRISQGLQPWDQSPLSRQMSQSRLQVGSKREELHGLSAGMRAPLLEGAQLGRAAIKPWEKDHIYLLYFWNSSNAAAVQNHLAQLRSMPELQDERLVVIAVNVLETNQERAGRLFEELNGSNGIRLLFDKNDSLSSSWKPEGGWRDYLLPFCFLIHGGSEGAGHIVATADKAQFSKVQELARQLLARSEQQKTAEALGAAFDSGDWVRAQQLAEALQGQLTNEEKLNCANTFALVFNAAGAFDKALNVGKEFLAKTSDPCLLDAMAMCLLQARGTIPAENIALAYEMALKSNTASLKGECRSKHLRTLARATFMKGDPAKAAHLAQEAAIEIGKMEQADDVELSAQTLAQELDWYRQGVLPPL